MSGLRKIRQRKGLTLKQLGERVGRSEGAISKYESQDHRLTLPVMRLLASELDSTISEIAEEEMPQKGPNSAQLSPEIAAINEMDIHVSVGGGAVVETERVKCIWYFPTPLIRELRASPKDIQIVPVEGNSMEPVLFSGDRVMVDVSRIIPSPPGIFALWDGLGTIIKEIEYIPGSDPESIFIRSANPRYPPYERTMEEVNIIGRVIWFSRAI